MDKDAELMREWIDAARGLQATMERLPLRRVADGIPVPATNAGNISVRLDSSKAPWMMHIAVTSAIICAVLSIITLLGGGMLYLNMKDHLDAIYMMAPQLKPTEQNSHVDHHPDPQAEGSATQALKRAVSE